MTSLTILRAKLKGDDPMVFNAGLAIPERNRDVKTICNGRGENNIAQLKLN
ncbi:MAG: hypothetical protein M3Y53_01650 [Thermoproteota archaeon]|nr:hypothetical protein [Thermoproteota archaeon]